MLGKLTDSSGGTAARTVPAVGTVSTAGGNTYADAAVNTPLAAIANGLACAVADINDLKDQIASIQRRHSSMPGEKVPAAAAAADDYVDPVPGLVAEIAALKKHVCELQRREGMTPTA
jgi:hypothetical protein